MNAINATKGTLSDADRAALPGSFVRLSRGFVHYELSGPEDGPVVVLVPGLSVPYSTWDRNASALASAGYRVLRYEHYGRGYSDRPCVLYDLDLYVEQLAELLSAIGIAQPSVLVGLSMGGPVAAAAATRHPGIARALILIDPLYEWPEPDLRSRLIALPILGEAVMALRGGAILAEGQRVDFFDPRALEDFMPSYFPPLRYRGIPRAVLATIRSIPSWPLATTYAELGLSGLPTLLFWGRMDATLPFEQSASLLASVPQAEFRPIEGAGHVPHWERPGEVNEAMIEFLRRQA
jgi:pimeloyl-ACP methyl ester carboxylesterase